MTSPTTSTKNILVTGGSGFLGSHLCDKLIQQGHKVTCLDNHYTGSMDNIQHLISNPHFIFILADVVDMTLDKFDEACNFDQIYHLACPASPVDYQADPIKTIKTNVIGTMNMLELAKKNNARILLTSTSEVYGDPNISPQSEKYWGNVNCVGIRSCYDEGKRVAETLMTEYNRIHSVDTRIARIFNTYGPRLNAADGRVVSNFIVQALKGIPLTMYGDGSQTRSFCFVDDQIAGLMALMNVEDPAYHMPVNIGNPGEITIAELADHVLRLTGSNSEIIKQPLPQDDPMRRKPDITLAKNILGWEPSVDLREGLIRTIEYFNR